MNSWRLLIQCAEQRRLVHRVTGVLLQHGCNVHVNHEFADLDSGRFFMRTEFVGELEPGAVVEACRTQLPPDAIIRLTRPNCRRVVVLASHEHHCVADLLERAEDFPRGDRC